MSIRVAISLVIFLLGCIFVSADIEGDTLVHIQFDEGSGATLADSSGNSGPFSLVGDEYSHYLWQSTGCPSGSCLDFSTAYFNIPSSVFEAVTTEMTVSMWLKFESCDTSALICYSFNEGTYDFAIHIYTVALLFEVGTASVWHKFDCSELTEGAEYQFSFNGAGDISISRNGVSGTAVASIETEVPAMISTTVVSGLYVVMDEFKITNSATDFSSPSLPTSPSPTNNPEGDTVVYFQFDEGSGFMLTDSSGSDDLFFIYGSEFLNFNWQSTGCFSGSCLDSRMAYFYIFYSVFDSVSTEITISMWLKFSSCESIELIMFNHNGLYNDLEVFRSSTELQFQVGVDSVSHTYDCEELMEGAEYQFSFNGGGGISISRDGVLGTAAASKEPLAPAMMGTIVGDDFIGVMDEFKITNAAMTFSFPTPTPSLSPSPSPTTEAEVSTTPTPSPSLSPSPSLTTEAEVSTAGDGTGTDETNTGTDDETNTGTDDETNTGTDETNTGTDDETNTGTDDETNTGTDDETNTGTDDETNIGTDDETNTGTDDDTNTGTDEINTGTDEINTGTDEINTGSDDETNTGTDDETNTGNVVDGTDTDHDDDDDDDAALSPAAVGGIVAAGVVLLCAILLISNRSRRKDDAQQAAGATVHVESGASAVVGNAKNQVHPVPPV